MAKNKPAHDFSLGRIRAAIWKNTNDQGRSWFNTEVVRVYNDGDEFKETHSFSRDDLPVVAKAYDMAYAWIWEQHVAARSDKANQEE